MGYSVFLTPKTRDGQDIINIMNCEDSNGRRFFSDEFALFQSRFVFDKSEIEQVQKILSIDLSVYLRYPKNHHYDTGELDYQLYKAEQENDLEKMERIKIQIKEEIKIWDLTYDTNNVGWSTIDEFRNTTFNFIQAINNKPEFGSEIILPEDIYFPWGDYFSIKEKDNKNERRIMEDLNTLLSNLECIEKHGIEYVGFVGG